MNLKLVKLQAMVCILMILIFAAEFVYGQYNDRRLQKKLQYTESSDETPAQLPTLAEQKPAAEAYAEMVERPLFIQGRKPVVEADAASKTQAVDTGQIDEWLLIGVYNKDKTQVALFSKKNESKKYQKISSGQMIAGWLLKEIKPDHVILEQAGQEKSILLRKPRPESKTPVHGKPPVARPAPPPPAQPNNNPENVNDESETN
ncbi:MAG: hypothetical protein ACXV7J_04110 [Methylomonas sp.]